MNEKLAEALDHVRDAHITEAARPKKARGAVFLRIVAAAAVIALIVGVATLPPPITAKAVSLPGENRRMAYPQRAQYATTEEFQAALAAYRADQAVNSDRIANAKSALSDFFTQGSAQFVSGEENAIWSPVNAFIGLSMAAELTQGESRRQILDLFGAKDMEALRGYASAIWETAYKDDGNEICTLANSLWLRDNLSYEQAAMDNLAYHYYASIYKGKMGSVRMNSAIGAWLNQNTGGMLKNATDNISLSPETVLALYSTIYLQSKWQDAFRAANNTRDVFHAPSGDRNVTYMNKKLSVMEYCWGDTFGAVSLSLKNGSRMWFILPDAGVTTSQVLADGQYMQMILGQWENSGFYKVNLSVPKFDVSSNQNLRAGLQEMGLTDVFDPNHADFSAITNDVPVYLTAANQAVRVQIDEEGVKAAAYIEIPGAGSPQPPDEIVDFILDRPFLFVITSQSVPLFVGTVNEP